MEGEGNGELDGSFGVRSESRPELAEATTTARPAPGPSPGSRGVIFSVSGARFLREATISATTIRQHMPGLPIAIFTDQTEVDRSVFDQVYQIEQPVRNEFDKQWGFRCPLFEFNLFLDCDTWICRPFDELFELLERFDVGAVRESFCGSRAGRPDCFDDFNAGMILFRRTPATERMLARWYELTCERLANRQLRYSDQPALSLAMYETQGLSVYVLGDHYNLRLNVPRLVSVWARPVILHGRPTNLEEVARRLDQEWEHQRLVMPNLGSGGRLRIHLANAGTHRGWSLVLFLVQAPFRLASWLRRRRRRR